MSRNRTAILADIEQFNLNPSVPHRATFANGRLAKTVMSPDKIVTDVVEIQVETVVQHVVESEVIEPVVDTSQQSINENTLDFDETKIVESTLKKKGKK